MQAIQVLEVSSRRTNSMMNDGSPQGEPLAAEIARPELCSKYDFSMGVRGKYWAAYQRAIAAGRVGPEELELGGAEEDGGRI